MTQRETRVINWAILGTSPISAVMAKAIKHSNYGRLYAIYSRGKETGSRFAKEHKIPFVYADFTALLADKNVNAIYIGLPNYLHKEFIIECAKAGKHILCEKPLVVSVAEAEEVRAQVKKANVLCIEALMYRFHPFTKQLKDIIRKGILGDIKHFQALYNAHITDVANRTAGGAIRNLGCYPISLIRLLQGAEPKHSYGCGRPYDNDPIDHAASVVLQFANKSTAAISVADDLPMTWQFHVYGTGGTLQTITNPWMPTTKNKILIKSYQKGAPTTVYVSAEKPLYTYQIDYVNEQILAGHFIYEGDNLLSDSYANTRVLEDWFSQVFKNEPVVIEKQLFG